MGVVKPYEDHAVVCTENEKSSGSHFRMFLELLMKLVLRIRSKKCRSCKPGADCNEFPAANSVSIFAAGK